MQLHGHDPLGRVAWQSASDDENSLPRSGVWQPRGRSWRARRHRTPGTQTNPCALLCRSPREVRPILSRACSQTSFQRGGASRCSSRISRALATTSAPSTWQGPIPTDTPSCSTPAPLQRTPASTASSATMRLRILGRSRLSRGWTFSCSCRIPRRPIPLKNSSTMSDPDRVNSRWHRQALAVRRTWPRCCSSKWPT